MDFGIDSRFIGGQRASYSETLGGVLLPGKTLFVRISGSRGYNTQIENSDTDYAAVYVLSTDEILSLASAQETFTHNKPDIEAHEVKKFCELLLKGNPSMVEHLFAKEKIYADTFWNDLLLHKKEFLSVQVVKQYLGYALSQLHRLENHQSLQTTSGKYNNKWAYHMIRVLNDAYRIAQGEEPVVWKEGVERDLLLNIRHEKYPQEKIVEMAKREIVKIDNLKPWPLPEFGNRDFLNGWLLNIRKQS